MKNIIVFIVFGASVTFANAQTNKATFLLGTSSGFGGSRSQVLPIGPVSREFQFDVEGGYFIADGLVIGSAVSISKFDRLTSKGNSITVTPFVRYFLTESLFVGAGYGIGREKSERITQHPISGENIWLKNKFRIQMELFEVGYALWLTEKISLEPTLNYSYIFPGHVSRPRRKLGFRIGLKVYL